MGCIEATRQAVADEVRAAMARRRVTQAVLASELCISRASLSERLAGHRPFDIDQLAKASRFLGVELVDLFPDAEEAAAS